MQRLIDCHQTQAKCCHERLATLSDQVASEVARLSAAEFDFPLGLQAQAQDLPKLQTSSVTTMISAVSIKVSKSLIDWEDPSYPSLR
jgi:hypothetical protein